MMKTILYLTLTFTLITIVGCSRPTSEDSAGPTGKQYLMNAEPANVTPVGMARKSARNGDTVALIGHIGGSAEPFVKGMAAFKIVDPKVKYCPPEEGCPKPWDYCCTQNEVKENIATVKVVNKQGEPVLEDAKKLLGVKELSLVVVQGTTQRDKNGNLSVLANKIFIKK